MVIVWTEDFDDMSFIPVVADAWTDYDIYTYASVDKGAIPEIMCINESGLSEQLVGVRTDESSLTRSVTLHSAEGGGVTVINMLVTVHATTGLIEYYADTTGFVNFVLTGYWTGVAFTELASIYTPSSTGWQNYDIATALSVPNGRVIQVHCYHDNEAAATIVGVRTDESSLTRYDADGIHEAEGGGINGYTTFVKSDSSTGYIETYVDNTTHGHFLILGYFDDTMDYQELWSAKTVDNNATWEDEDITSDLDEDGRVTNFVLLHSTGNAERLMGARINGGSDFERMFEEHEAESNGRTGFELIVQSDAGGVVELYAEAKADTTFYLAGYFFPAGEATEHYQTITDLTGLLDSVAKKHGIKKPITDQTGLLDSVLKKHGVKKIVSDLTGLLDTVSTIYDGILSTSDIVGLLDTVATLKARFQSVIDQLGLLDSVTTTQAHKLTVTDLVGLLDSIALKHNLKLTVTDIGGLLDTVTLLKAMFLTVTDYLGLLDSVDIQIGFTKTILDYVGLLDSIAKKHHVKITVNDLTGLTDTISIVLNAQLTVTDKIGLLDTILTALAMHIAVNDLTGLLDSVVLVWTQALTQTDILGLLDSITTSYEQARGGHRYVYRRWGGVQYKTEVPRELLYDIYQYLLIKQKIREE